MLGSGVERVRLGSSAFAPGTSTARAVARTRIVGGSQLMLSLLTAGMVRAATPSRSAARMCTKAGPIKFDMDFSANWFAARPS